MRSSTLKARQSGAYRDLHSSDAELDSDGSSDAEDSSVTVRCSNVSMKLLLLAVYCEIP